MTRQSTGRMVSSTQSATRGPTPAGQIVIKDSEFNDNQDGFDTDSENGDAPSPQNGACPNNAISPITHTHSCWVLINNYIHDNNNRSVPEVGQAGPRRSGWACHSAEHATTR